MPLTPDTHKWVDLQVGDCIAEVPAVDLGEVSVSIVDCAATHAAEVYLRAPVEVNAAVADVANGVCSAGVPAYTGRPVDGSPYSVTYLIDSGQDRTANNPLPSTVICLLQSASGQPLTRQRGGEAGQPATIRPSWRQHCTPSSRPTSSVISPFSTFRTRCR